MKKSKIMILLLVVAMVLTLSAVSAADTNDTRSEERRVGKEC